MYLYYFIRKEHKQTFTLYILLKNQIQTLKYSSLFGFQDIHLETVIVSLNILPN